MLTLSAQSELTRKAISHTIDVILAGQFKADAECRLATLIHDANTPEDMRHSLSIAYAELTRFGNTKRAVAELRKWI